MIRFPKINIATSTVNRILNVADEITAGANLKSAPTPRGAPNVPDTSRSGPAIDAALAAPTAASDAAPEIADAVALKGIM